MVRINESSQATCETTAAAAQTGRQLRQHSMRLLDETGKFKN